MIKVIAPQTTHQPEVTYVLDVILRHFFNLAYSVEWRSEVTTYEFKLSNGNRLIVADDFFRHHTTPLSYLDSRYLPQSIQWATSTLAPEPDIPVLFGEAKITTTSTTITCDIDIIASIYFMLSRWEETVSLDRDHHGRFEAKHSISGRCNCLHRPIVDELVGLVWNMLSSLDPALTRKPSRFEAIITHDVDDIAKWTSPTRFVRSTMGELIRHRNPFKTLRTLWQVARGTAQDPYDTFDYIMTLSEQNGLRSHFFFMVGGTSTHDQRYDILGSAATKLIDTISKRGHQIGYHPSYNTNQTPALFCSEIATLRAISKQPVVSGRQHYLRFSVPDTWRIWSQNGMQWDTTLGFAETLGFRAGTCHPFPVFDCRSRQPLPLVEIPLTMMEATCIDYMKLSPTEMKSAIRVLIKVVQKYQGTMVVLWHNSSFNTAVYEPYQPIYEWLMKELGTMTTQAL